MKSRNNLSSTKFVLGFLLGLVFILGVSSAISGWNYSFKYQVSAPDYLNNTSEYQVLVKLDTAYLVSHNGLKHDCSDLRAGNETTFFPVWIEDGTCNTNETLIWVKLPKLVDGEIFYVYTGNSTATSVSNWESVFSYSRPVPLYYVVSNYTTTLRITAFGNNTHVIVKDKDNNTKLDTTIDKMQTVSVNGVGLGTVIMANKSIYAEGHGAYDDAMVPAGFVGKHFIYTGFRDSKDTFCFLSPHGNADVEVRDASSTWWSGTVNSSGTCIQKNVGTTDAVEINSNKPILAYYYGASGEDSYPMYKASKELYGVPSQYAYAAAGSNSTSVRYYGSDGSSGIISINVNQGTSEVFSGSQGSTPAYKFTSEVPIGVIQQADSDGTESTTFLPKEEFGTVFVGGEDLQYIAIVTTSPNTTCRLVNSENIVNLSISEFSNGIGKIYYKPSSALSAPWMLSCDTPVYAYYEYNSKNAERNMFSQIQSRRGPLTTARKLMNITNLTVSAPDLGFVGVNFTVNATARCTNSACLNVKLNLSLSPDWCDIETQNPISYGIIGENQTVNASWIVRCNPPGRYTLRVSARSEGTVSSSNTAHIYISPSTRYLATLKVGSEYLPGDNITATLSVYDMFGPSDIAPKITIFYPNFTEMANGTMTKKSPGVYIFSTRLPLDAPLGDYLVVANGTGFISTAIFQVKNTSRQIILKLDQILANQSRFSQRFDKWNTTFYFWNNTYFANWNGKILGLSGNWTRLWNELNCTQPSKVCQYLEAIQLVVNSTNETVSKILQNQTRYFPTWDSNWKALWDRFDCVNGTYEICEYLENINNTAMNMRSSQALDFKASLVDVDRVQTGKEYDATVVIVNYTNHPMDADSNPIITIRDPSGSIAFNGTMNKSGLGYYVFSRNLTGPTGNWETTVTITVKGVTFQLHSYWEMVGSAPQVKVLGISDRTIPTIIAQAEIENEGNSPFEYHYVYCFTSSRTEKCGDPTNICYGTGSKLIKPGEIWTSSFECNRITEPGRYWFKIDVYWGSEKSSASKDFYAVPEEFKHYSSSEPVIFIKDPKPSGNKTRRFLGGISFSITPLEGTWETGKKLPIGIDMWGFGNFTMLPATLDYAVYNQTGKLMLTQKREITIIPSTLELLDRLDTSELKPGKYRVCAVLKAQGKEVESCAPFLLVEPEERKTLKAASIMLRKASQELSTLAQKMEMLDREKKLMGGYILAFIYTVALAFYVISVIRIKRKSGRIKLKKLPKNVTTNLAILGLGFGLILISGLITQITGNPAVFFYGSLGTSIITIVLILVISSLNEMG